MDALTLGDVLCCLRGEEYGCHALLAAWFTLSSAAPYPLSLYDAYWDAVADVTHQYRDSYLIQYGLSVVTTMGGDVVQFDALLYWGAVANWFLYSDHCGSLGCVWALPQWGVP